MAIRDANNGAMYAKWQQHPMMAQGQFHPYPQVAAAQLARVQASSNASQQSAGYGAHMFHAQAKLEHAMVGMSTRNMMYNAAHQARDRIQAHVAQHPAAEKIIDGVEKERRPSVETMAIDEIDTVSIVITKPFKQSMLGIGLESQRGRVHVTSIAQDGLFANTGLKVGMRLHSVNKRSFTSSKEAATILKWAQNQVVVVASNPDEDEMTLRGKPALDAAEKTTGTPKTSQSDDANKDGKAPENSEDPSKNVANKTEYDRYMKKRKLQDILAKIPQKSPAKDATAAASEGSENGEPPEKKGKPIRFAVCGHCPKCKLSNCGECKHCKTKKTFGGKLTKTKRCLKRRCEHMVSRDGHWEQVVVQAPAGPMGLTIEIDEDQSIQFVQTAPKWMITKVNSDVCSFHYMVRPGYQLLWIEGKRIVKGTDLAHKMDSPREVVFVRYLTIPKMKYSPPKIVIPKEPKPPVDVWKSKEAASLFGFKETDDMKQLLQGQIDALKIVNQDKNGYKKFIPEDWEELKPLYGIELMMVRHRALFIIKAYTYAIEKMNRVNRSRLRLQGKWLSEEEGRTMGYITWEDCINWTLKDLNDMGITLYTSIVGVRILQKLYCRSGLLMEKRIFGMFDYTDLFHYYPLIKKMIVDFVRENKDHMSAKLLQEEVASNILPAAMDYAKENNHDENKANYKLLAKAVADPPKVRSMSKWIQVCGLRGTYDTRHTRRGEEWAKKQSVAGTKFWADPEKRKEHSKQMKEHYKHNPQKGGIKKNKKDHESESEPEEAPHETEAEDGQNDNESENEGENNEAEDDNGGETEYENNEEEEAEPYHHEDPSQQHGEEEAQHYYSQNAHNYYHEYST